MTAQRAATRQERAAVTPSPRHFSVAPLLIALPVASLLLASGPLQLHWLLLTALVVTLMVAVGTVTRALGGDSLGSRGLAWWLQLAVLFTLLLLRQAAIGDWEAGASPRAVTDLFVSLGTAIADGAWNIAWYSELPYPRRDTIDTVILVVAGLLVLLNDLVMRITRAPALAILWSFAPLALPLQVGMPVSPLLVVPVAALLLIALLSCSRPRQRMPSRPVGAAVVAAVTALAVALPFALPDPREVAARIPADIRDIGPALFPPALPMLNESIDLASNLQRSQPVDVLRYRTSGSWPTRLRLTTLGDTSQGGFAEFPLDETAELAPVDLIWQGDETQVSGFRYSVESLGFVTRSLPVPARSLAVTIDSGRVAGFDETNESIVIAEGRERLEEGLAWDGTAVGESDLTDALRSSDLDWLLQFSVGGTPALADSLDDLPEGIAALRPLAESIVGDAETDIVMLHRLVQWFETDDWQYSEQVPFAGFGSAPEGQWEALQSFLEERVGYCVHYATALAALARSLGIPARVPVGFLEGRFEEGWQVVDTNDMHAWTEVYVQGIGWAELDVTPAILGGDRQASASGSNPYGESGTAPTPREADEPSASPAEPEPTDDALDPNQQSHAPEDTADPTESGDAADAQDAEAVDVTWLLLVLAIVTALLLPALVRSMQHARRRRDGAIGAWREVLAVAIDTGVDIRPRHTAAQTAADLQTLLPGCAGEIRALARAAEAAAFGGPKEAAKPYDRTAVDAVSQALWERLHPLPRLLGRLLPTSLLPQSIRSWRRR